MNAAPPTSASLRTVVLAAGKGTRMKSDLPKVMHPAYGRPMVEWVVDAAFAAGSEEVILVIGHGAELVRSHFASHANAPRVRFALQERQLGTGHAVDMARGLLEGRGGDTLVLCGDGPLIRRETLATLLATHRSRQAAATLATSVIPDPAGYGRIERDAAGSFLRIVEQKDATPAQLALREVNPSYYCFRTGDLLAALGRLDNRNSSGEYYLTDTFEWLRNRGQTVAVVDAVPPEDILSVNTPEQLAEVDAILRRRGAAPAAGAFP
jgi:bifunctional UDP-N-acetylglucosamine pyrophosphorylase/glucosamine-1-phosphate N-acetyltransferase